MPVTGQRECYDARGAVIPCIDSGQDGEFRVGRQWPERRFEVKGNAVVDNLTGLCWLRDANLTKEQVPWSDALKSVAELNLNSDGEMNWSSTTSMFEPDWAWALYLAKGAVGVGQKWGAHFYIWPVCDTHCHRG